MLYVRAIGKCDFIATRTRTEHDSLACVCQNMCRNINVHVLLATVIAPEVCNNVHVFGTAHNVTVGVEKAPERSCVLGVSQETGRFRINNILNYKTAVPWPKILTLTEISVDVGPIALLWLPRIACLFNAVLHGFIYGCKMLTDQSQRLYLHEIVRTLCSCVSVKSMQFLFSTNALYFFSPEVYNIVWTSCCL
jgi:hypothetical protein